MKLSKIDERRLRDGAVGLGLPTDDLAQLTLAELEARRSSLHDAAVAMQSLDDLGSTEANQRAWDEMVELGRRLDKIQKELERRQK
jgi:hypothetical protein